MNVFLDTKVKIYLYYLIIKYYVYYRTVAALIPVLRFSY